MRQNLKTEYWIDGQYLAAPLDGFTQNQFDKFWAGFDPLPPILDNARNQHYRTKDDLFATFELVNDWEPTEIAQQVAAALESRHVGQYQGYFRIISSSMLNDAPSSFYRHSLDFLEMLEQGAKHTFDEFTDQFNRELKQCFVSYRNGANTQTAIEMLTMYEFNVLSQLITLAVEARDGKLANNVPNRKMSCSI